MEYSFVKTELRGKVGIVTLNRSDALNILNEQMLIELADAMENFDHDDNVHALVLQGSEKAFCAGLDVKEFSGAIDVSNADEVDMSWADWANLGDIKFKDGAKVNFEYSQNLPSDIDWSKFSEVKMQFCILNARRDMVFRNGAKVDLSIATLPECVMDFSLCAEVNLSETTVPKKAHFIFKNRAQTEESKLVLPKKWKGRISFKDELDDVSKSPKNTSLGGLFGKFFTKDGR